MAPENVSSPALEEHYQRQYRTDLESEAEWLRRTATDKVDSIHYLLKNISIIPHSILEVGCGPGAVLRECQRRDIGQKHVGLDYSEEALDYLRRNSEGIDTITADIRSSDFAVEEPFDLVVLSHVLEHLQDPGACLQSIVRRVDFSYLILEVPLEDLFLNNLISWFRGRENSAHRHLQFFNVASFRNLVSRNKLTIIDQRCYTPVLALDTIRYASAHRVRYPKGRSTKLQVLSKALTQHYLPKLLGPLKMRIHYAHYAVLCRENEPGT